MADEPTGRSEIGLSHRIQQMQHAATNAGAVRQGRRKFIEVTSEITAGNTDLSSY